MNADKAPSFDEMVREGKAVTLGEAKQYAAALPAEKRRTASARRMALARA